nr:uncharacterized protein LOC129387686 [Dermacentor andersoni]
MRKRKCGLTYANDLIQEEQRVRRGRASVEEAAGRKRLCPGRRSSGLPSWWPKVAAGSHLVTRTSFSSFLQPAVCERRKDVEPVQSQRLYRRAQASAGERRKRDPAAASSTCKHDALQRHRLPLLHEVSASVELRSQHLRKSHNMPTICTMTRPGQFPVTQGYSSVNPAALSSPAYRSWRYICGGCKVKGEQDGWKILCALFPLVPGAGLCVISVGDTVKR